jgi:septal ring factor EnvC (AmiA/AmiB activator)
MYSYSAHFEDQRASAEAARAELALHRDSLAAGIKSATTSLAESTKENKALAADVIRLTHSVELVEKALSVSQESETKLKIHITELDATIQALESAHEVRVVCVCMF